MEEALLAALRGRRRNCAFVSELLASAGAERVEGLDLDRALADLQGRGLVIVRDHFCGDPHLANADLRIVALTDGTPEAQEAAIAAIDTTWDRWLADYLANHRCA